MVGYLARSAYLVAYLVSSSIILLTTTVFQGGGFAIGYCESYLPLLLAILEQLRDDYQIKARVLFIGKSLWPWWLSIIRFKSLIYLCGWQNLEYDLAPSKKYPHHIQQGLIVYNALINDYGYLPSQIHFCRYHNCRIVFVHPTFVFVTAFNIVNQTN